MTKTLRCCDGEREIAFYSLPAEHESQKAPEMAHAQGPGSWFAIATITTEIVDKTGVDAFHVTNAVLIKKLREFTQCKSVRLQSGFFQPSVLPEKA